MAFNFSDLGNLFAGGGADGKGSFGAMGDWFGSATSAFNPDTNNGFGAGALTQKGLLGDNKSLGLFTGGMKGFGDLANAYAGIQGINLAKDQMGMQRDFANENMKQQVDTYNSNMQRSIANSPSVLNGRSVEDFMAQYGKKTNYI